MNITYKVTRIGVNSDVGGKKNVIANIAWQLVAERNGFTSISVVDTLIPIGDLSNFVPVEQVSKQQALDWAIAAEGGNSFIQMLTEHHERVLSAEEKRAAVELYLGPLAFELDAAKDQFITQDMPVSTL